MVINKYANLITFIIFLHNFKLLFTSKVHNAELANVTNSRFKRDDLGYKRYLIFPQGSNVQVSEKLNNYLNYCK